MNKLRLTFALVGLLGCVLLVVWLSWQRDPMVHPTGSAKTSGAGARSELRPGFLTARPIGEEADPKAPAWITDLAIVDLDADGRKDVVACDARANRIQWIRQEQPGKYREQPIGESIAGPAHVCPCDIDGDGDLDLLIAAMGVVPPNNEKTGAVVILENDGRQNFTNRVVLERTYRVTDVQPGDFNGDGRLDLALAQFGYFEGQVQWLENQGEWRFLEHPLLDLSGAIHAPVFDVDRDGKLDIVSLVSQDWEEIWAFIGRGKGIFDSRVIHGSTNTDYGSSGISIADVDRDGISDIVWTNGDGFDYATPGSRPWHGVQWLRNDGRGNFRFHRVGKFPGAYSPVVTDLNGDGQMDIVAVSAFNDWAKPDAHALVCFENDGRQAFTPRILADAPTHMVVIKAADMDDDGKVELVSGCFAFYPPLNRAARVMLWEQAR